MSSPLLEANRVCRSALDTVLGSSALPSLARRNHGYIYSYYYYYAQPVGRSFAPGRSGQE